MKIRATIILILMGFASLISAEFLTVAEQSGFQKTSGYQDVIRFIHRLQSRYPDQIKIQYFARTTEGRKIPMIILSDNGISHAREVRIFNKPAILIMANIHAGEIEGKESTQMLAREILHNGRRDLIRNITLLIIPIFNCDGNEKMSSRNRRDNGPELAGERKNGQGYDLNRDFLKMESPEVTGLITRVFNKWDPVLFVDMHTTNGSYHQEPVTYVPNIAPEGDQSLTKYMWQKALPEIARKLKDTYGYDSIPYGNFVQRDDPTKGWRNSTSHGRFGTNYYGLRNRFSILNENYAHADYKTRVLASFGFIRSILEYVNDNIREMDNLIRQADINAIQKTRNSEFPFQFELTKTFDFVIKSYTFTKRKIRESERNRYPKKWYGDYLVEKTDTKKDYPTFLLSSFIPKKTVQLLDGYILLPSELSVARLLRRHGIMVQRINEAFTSRIRKYKVTHIESEKQIYQGHRLHKRIDFSEQDETFRIPKGAFYVSLSQPLSRLAAYLLEPKSRDGLIKWNFFDRVIVRQWRGYSFYPVFKTYETPKVEMTVMK